MPIETFLPALMCVQSFAAGFVYTHAGNYNSAAYWFLAAGLTAVVTFKPF